MTALHREHTLVVGPGLLGEDAAQADDSEDDEQRGRNAGHRNGGAMTA